ncbi:MAG: hypothetical protein ACC707_13640 [Thiohalomonadales bacterium]
MKSLILKLSLIGTLLFMSLVISGCDSDDDPVAKPKIVSLNIDPIISVAMLDSLNYYEVTAVDANGVTSIVNDQVEWSTELSPAIAEFVPYDAAAPDYPTVKMIMEGTDNIVVTLGSLTAKAQVNVTAPVALDSITVTPVNLVKVVGQSHQYSAMGTYANGVTRDLTYEVNWQGIGSAVTFSEFGLATVNQANQDLTVTATMGGLEHTVKISGYDAADITALRITPIAAQMFPGSTQAFEAYATFAGGAEANITYDSTTVWATADARTVDNAVTGTPNVYLAGTIPGEVKISMSYPAGAAPSTLPPEEALVTVTEFKVTGIFLNQVPQNTTVFRGMTIQFSAAAGVQGATNVLFPISASSNLSYVSSDESIAYFSHSPSSKGMLKTTSKGGTVTVTATFLRAGETFTDSVDITATAIPVPAL